jgi:hypothetical protein
MLNPAVVEIDSTGYSSQVLESVNFSFGSIHFGSDDSFHCGMITTRASVDYDRIFVLEKIVSLYGACWMGFAGNSMSQGLEVCIGKSITRYDRNQVGTLFRGSEIGTTNPMSDSGKITNGFHETFAANGSSIGVDYICSDEDQEPTLSDEGDMISIKSQYFCPNPTVPLIEQLLVGIPVISIFTDRRFWEYQFKFPDYAFQKHIDYTGATRNESYSLGYLLNKPSFTTIIERIVDVDGADYPHVVETLQYILENGTICEEFNLSRQSTISFQCPIEWEEVNTASNSPIGWSPYTVNGIGDKIFFARIKSVSEKRVCEYHYTIEATSLCIFHNFIPKVKSMEHNTVVKCSPLPGS